MTLSRRQPVQAALAGAGIESHSEADPWQRQISGMHHTFVSLRGALFSARAGKVRARNFAYRGLTA